MATENIIPARGTDPETSHAAVASINLSALEAVVHDALKQYPAGLTLDELMDVTGLQKVTVSPRLAPLVRKKQAGQNGKRKGKANRMQIVWIAI